jgi:hypothetical protein
MILDNETRVQKSIQWLQRANNVTNGKGFSIGFDIRKGWRAPYSETTGYIIPTLYKYALLYKSPLHADLATKAAEWLIENQNMDGSINDFVGSSSNYIIRSPVVFNTGQDLFGLISAYNHTNNNKFLLAAQKAAYWIISKQNNDGTWNDGTSFGAPTFASYYTHVSWPLLIVGKKLNDEFIIENANKALNIVLDNVNSNLSVNNWGFNKNEPAYTHTIAYTIEGILEQSLLNEGLNSKSFNIAKNMALHTISLLNRDGKFAGSYDLNWKGDYTYTCLPGNCQFSIIYLRLYYLLNDKIFLNAAIKSMQPVMNAQHTSVFCPNFIHGTIPASSPIIFGKYMRWLYPNWAAKYFADCLMLLELLTSTDDVSPQQYNLITKLLNDFPG